MSGSLNPSTQGVTSTIADSLHRGLGSLMDRLLIDVLLAGLAFALPHQPKDFASLVAFAIFFSMLLIALSDIVHYIRTKPVNLAKNGGETSGERDSRDRKPFQEKLELARKRAYGMRLSPV
jgi:hypothetical protein